MMEFQLNYFKSSKMMLWMCCTQYASKFGKLSSGYGTGKAQFSFQSQISHAIKGMLKIFQARLQQYRNHDFQMFKLDLEKAEEPEIKLPTSAGSWKKQESFRNSSISALLTMPKLLTMWITTNYGKFWKRREYQTTWPAFWEICMQVRKQQLELDMEQQIGSKSEKEYVKAIYCHPAHWAYVQSTSCKVLGWMKQKLESRLPGEISVISEMQITREKTKAPHSSTLAWKIPWMEELGRLQSMGWLRVGHDWATSLSLFMH